MRVLPTGWGIGALGDICRITSGATPKTSVPGYWGGEIPWITPNDMSKDRSQTLFEGARSLTSEGYASCSAQIVPAGSVIVSSRAPVGYVAIAGRELCTNQGCKSATPPDSIDPAYLYWFLVNAKNDLEARASGTTFKEISGRRFAETRLWWPELAEQGRIVAILEEHFSNLDQAARLLKRTRRRITALTQASLDRLVWGGGHPTTELSQVLGEPMRNGRSDRAVGLSETGIRALTLTAVTKGEFIEEHTKMVRTTEATARDLWLVPGDILVQRSNTPQLVGTAAMYDGPERWCIFPDLLIRLRPDPSRADNRYLEAALRSERAHRWLRGRAKGLSGSMPKIDQPTLASLPLPFPDLDRQHAIVAEFDDLARAVARIAGEVDRGAGQSAALRRAVLTAAFAGRLTGRSSDTDVIEELAEEASA